MRTLSLILLTLSLACGGGGGFRPGRPVQGGLQSAQGCKVFIAGTALIPMDHPDCLNWSVQRGELRLQHVNAAFNCCPGKIQADVSAEPFTRTLIIRERSTEEGCKCRCLYDLDYVIRDLAPGAWRVRIEVTGLPSDEPFLEAQVQVLDGAEGKQCLQRKVYPWAMGAAPEAPRETSR